MGGGVGEEGAGGVGEVDALVVMVVCQEWSAELSSSALQP